MDGDAPAYGLWFHVVTNSASLILFAFSFFKPRTKRDWRSFGAFLIACFRKMYGFPLMLGFLLQWPTLLTLAMFPVLVWM